ncbi:MAG: zf-HC2 domain-containing protein [Kofleriaceae bacterium]|nr:zf-HC2 domain-containing protein [Kofleriaceae bacterium]
MAECEHLARTSAYFDGELPDAEVDAALAHLASCAECQGLLGTAVAVDAAVSQAPSEVPRHELAQPHAREAARDEEVQPRTRDELASRRRRSRAPRWAIVGALAVAAAVLIWIGRREPAPAPKVALALPAERAVASRFTGEAFLPYRPYTPLRSASGAHEPISLEMLATLEKRGDTRNLVAALASSGDVARAVKIAAKLPDDAATESDRAALALATHDPETALVHAYRAVDGDGKLAPAWWNLGLVARELGLARVAKDAFERVVAAGERGWSDEAKTELAALERDIEAQNSTDLDARGKAMLDGGAVLTSDDVQRFPALTRFYFYDGLRVATSKADVDKLRPLATALDVASGTTTAVAAADRVAAADFGVRGKVAARYRELATRRASADAGAQLVVDLARLGAPVADIYLGAAVLTGEAVKRNADLRAIASAWHDPWFDLLLERDRIATAYPGDDLRAEPELTRALASCTNPAWSLRCGQLAMALGTLLVATGRIEDGEARVRDALSAFMVARAPQYYRHARTFLAEIHRRRGRYALARAEFEEEIFAAKQAGACDLVRYSEIGRANLAFMARDLDRAREFLPPAVPPEGCTPGSDVIGLVVAVDLARITGDARDAAAARAWVDHARAHGDGPPATIAAARLLPPDPAAHAALRTWLAQSKAGYATDALRVLGYSTLISDAGTRGAWSEVIDLAKAEYRLTEAPPCLLVTSLDDDRFTVAARVGDQVIGEASDEPALPAVSAAFAKKLASCTGIGVIARTQTHGRADLLPPEYPWWIVGARDGKPGAQSAASARALQVIDVRPPELPTLPPLPSLAASSERFDTTLAGAEATPDRVLAALATATYAEIHAHGIVSAANEDAAFLALSPRADGTFALDAGMIRHAKLTSAPFVVLAACRAAAVASVFRERWSLPDALLAAGARGVVAADIDIPDASVRAVLDELHHRLFAGEDAATALAAIRKARGGWAAHLMLFR